MIDTRGSNMVICQLVAIKKRCFYTNGNSKHFNRKKTMATTATATHRVTIPRKVSTRLTRRAKAEHTTISAVFVKLADEHEAMSEELEDIRFAAVCEERLADVKAGRDQLVPMSEIWKP